SGQPGGVQPSRKNASVELWKDARRAGESRTAGRPGDRAIEPLGTGPVRRRERAALEARCRKLRGRRADPRGQSRAGTNLGNPSLGAGDLEPARGGSTQ